MLPSLKLLSNDPCPYLRAGTCHRPYCPFRHCSSVNAAEIFGVDDEDDEMLASQPLSSKEKKKMPITTKNEMSEIEAKEEINESSEAIENQQTLIVAAGKGKDEEEADAERKRLEEEYERMLLGGDSSDDDVEIDTELLEQFLLPEDTDSEDPSDLFDACYKEWLRSKQEAENKPAKKEDEKESQVSTLPKPDKVSTSTNSVSPKRRVAHSNVETSSISLHLRPPTVNRVKLTPAQTLQNRYEEVQSSHASNRQESKDVEYIDSTKRVTSHSHTGFITMSCRNLGDAAAANEKPSERRVYLHTQIAAATLAQTSGKGLARKAHSPVQAPRRNPVVGRDTIAASKIPLNTRQHTLDQLFRACENIYDNYKEASQRAIAEEIVLSTRHKNKQVYIGASANCLKRLRDEAAEAQAAAKKANTREVHFSREYNPSSSTRSPIQSHQRVLVGSTKGSWSIEKKKPPEVFAKVTLYDAISTYLLTSDQLTDNGYPRPHPSGDRGRITTKNRKYKLSFSGDSTVRICDRCSKEFSVELDGTPRVKELCIYHHGRSFKRRVGGNYEKRFTCCDGEGSFQGCCVASLHVSVHPSDEIYGFVTAIKDMGDKSVMGNDPWDIVALDCEMLYTTYGSELARATFLSADKKVLYDELVKPIHPIIDYNTRYSGITEEMMKEVKTSLTDVQAVLLSRLRPNSILIGHSLESDLMALKLKHDYVIDTSILMPHSRGLPYKRALRSLASDCLGKIIQTGEDGHDSAEDALTALELVLWKVQGDRLLRESIESKRAKH